MSGPKPSTGRVPRRQPLADANQAVALLQSLHNWSCSMTRGDAGIRYQVTVRHAGRRCTGYGREFLAAVQNALLNLRDDSTQTTTRKPGRTALRLVGGDA